MSKRSSRNKNRPKAPFVPTNSSVIQPIDPRANIVGTGIVSMSQHTLYAGPIPPPEVLREFNEISPGFADRIIAMAEKQAAHRQEMEKTVIGGDAERSKLGLWFAFALSLLGISIGGAITAHGYPWGGAAVGLGPITSIAYAFLRVERKRKGEIEAKASAVRPQGRK